MNLSLTTFEEPLCIYGDGRPKASELSDLMLANGIASATTKQIADYLSIPQNQVRQRMKPLRDRGKMVSPARGLWAPVPPERRAWGAPEPEAYLDDLMAYLGADYYVAWLSAAALHGAAHQAPQRYQVATSVAVADRTVGRTAFEFHRHSGISRVPRQRIVNREGTVIASTPAATMLDLLEDLQAAGGINNAITAACELALIHSKASDGQNGLYADMRPSYVRDSAWGSLNDQLLVTSGLHSIGCLRRLGWALEHYVSYELPCAFHEAAISGPSTPTPLDPGEPTEDCPVEPRWMLAINVDPEPDL